jgi:two-component system alkaline phosphatase synthesis response regulator PhoP
MTQRSTNDEVVLVVEDDHALRLGMEKTLRAEGFTVCVEKRGDEGLARALAEGPDLVLLDVMMPGKNGFEVCEALRAFDPDLPIVFVSAKGSEEDKVRGLGLGADDYLVKPFGTAELVARVNAALRRRRLARKAIERLEFGDVVVDFVACTVTKAGASIQVTALELRLLQFFALREGQMLPRQRILASVWGAEYFGTDRTVDNFVTRLRQKLEPDASSPRFFLTLRGAGYRFDRSGKGTR